MKKAALFVVLVAISLVYLPRFWTFLFAVVDFYTSYDLFECPIYERYHNFLHSFRTETTPKPLQEINASEVTKEKVWELTKGHTVPLVIRGLLGNTTAVQNWHRHDWWIDNYGDEEVLCGTQFKVLEDDCTVRGFFNALKAGKPFYLAGAAQIVNRHPELHEMMDNENIRALEPAARRMTTQIYMGVAGSGTDIHCASGLNIFRQVAGQKKWWFIPPSESAYVYGTINANGFSAHTKTKIGLPGIVQSPWFKNLERYYSVLNPGDILINTPWYWHGIENIGEQGSNELIIGAPSRYIGGVASFKSNFPFAINSFLYQYSRFGNEMFKPDFKFDVHKDVANDRRAREGKPAQE